MEQEQWLSIDVINQITSVATEKAIEAFKREIEKEKEKEKRNRSRNMVNMAKRTLKSYKRIKNILRDGMEYSEEEKADMRFAFLRDIMETPEEKEVKTELIIKEEDKRRKEDLYAVFRIEKAMELYKNETEKSSSEEEKRRYRVLNSMYMEEHCKSVTEIAESEHVSERTIFRDINEASKVIAVYLYGLKE